MQTINMQNAIKDQIRTNGQPQRIFSSIGITALHFHKYIVVLQERESAAVGSMVVASYLSERD